MEQQSTKIDFRKLLVIGGAIIFVLVLLYVIFTYTIITLSTQTSASPDITIKLASLSTKKEKSYTLAVGDEKKYIVKKGAYNVIATQGKNQTISSFVAQGFSMNELVVTLKNEVQVSRVATASLGCGKRFGGVYFSHRCGGDVRVFKHTPFSGNNRATTEQLSTSSTYRSTVEHKGGILGIIDDQEGGILLEDLELPSQRSVRINSDFANGQDTSGLTLVANQSNSYQYEFGVIDQKNGVWRLYKNTSDSQPIEIDAARGVGDIKKYSMVNQSNQLKGNTLISLYDIYTDPGEGTGKEQDNIRNRNVVTITNTSTKKTVSYLLPDTRDHDSVLLSDQTHLISKTTGGHAVIYDISGDTAQKVAEYDNVTAVNVYDSSTLIGINRGIYKMQPDGNTIFRLFESERLNLSDISQSEEGVEFTAFVNESDPLYTSPDVYRLDLDKKAVYPQDQEFLPYTNSTIRSMDYSDTQIQVQLALTTISFDRSTGQVSYDPEEFKELAEEARLQLAEKNLIRGRQIIFSY